MDLQEIMLNAQENEDDIEKQSFSDDMVRRIKLYGIDIEESDFNSCRFRECEFEKVYFKNVSFKGCDLSNIHMYDCTFKQCSFDKCRITGSSFPKACWKAVSFPTAQGLTHLSEPAHSKILTKGLYSQRKLLCRCKAQGHCFEKQCFQRLRLRGSGHRRL